MSFIVDIVGEQGFVNPSRASRQNLWEYIYQLIPVYVRIKFIYDDIILLHPNFCKTWTLYLKKIGIYVLKYDVKTQDINYIYIFLIKYICSRNPDHI